jgi:formamidopyrimidine-DNA glycosylase
MPELPDITVYKSAMERFVVGRMVEQIVVRSPFLVRTFDPDLMSVVGCEIVGVRRLGKRIIWEISNGSFVFFHLMIAGRFHWKKAGTRPTRKVDLAAFDFKHGTLMLTEAGTKKRAALFMVADERGLAEHDRGGLDVLNCSLSEFSERLLCENHTLKRSLTDPRLFDGIGNAYSDEILHAARLSPIKLSQKLDIQEIARLLVATQTTLQDWTDRLIKETGDGFPEKVTAFREGMAVHGRFKMPCPVCETPVQRIRYASNETNYCPKCQTEGKVLADRSLSRLLKEDWPRTIEELES